MTPLEQGKLDFRPGPGWYHLGGSVYEHSSGIRIHVAGLCGFPPAPIVNGMIYPVSRELDRFVRINGGNRKRGMMAWALHVLRSRKLFRQQITTNHTEDTNGHDL